MGIFKSDRINIVMMIEPGRLEWQGIMLIESIKKYCMDDFKIFVYCRVDKLKVLCLGTLRYLSENGIALTLIENDFFPDYPQGNKVIAVSKSRRWADFGVFLDTDNILIKKVSFLKELARPRCISVVPADRRSWTINNEDWNEVYKACGAKISSETILLRNHEKSPPYFNAGMIVFPENGGFRNIWLECSKLIDGVRGVENKRPWLDQVALPVAISKAGLKHNIVSDKYNFALHAENINLKNVVLGHYHTLKWVRYYGLNKEMAEYSKKSLGCDSFKEFRDSVMEGAFGEKRNSSSDVNPPHSRGC